MADQLAGPKMVMGGGGWYYALGTWSSDGRKVLVMEDVSGRHFTMYATSVDEPFETTTIVERVEVNHGRSWPGNGDVSWQPVFAAAKSPWW